MLKCQSGDWDELVRVERIELSFQPWEGCILATIRYPHNRGPRKERILCGVTWSHLGDSNPGPPLYESGALANWAKMALNRQIIPNWTLLLLRFTSVTGIIASVIYLNWHSVAIALRLSAEDDFFARSRPKCTNSTLKEHRSEKSAYASRANRSF